MRSLRIELACAVSALAIVASSCTQGNIAQSSRTPKAPVSSTSEPPSSTTTTTPFAMEPCGGIISNTVLDPTVNLEPFLLTPGEVPTGYTTRGPQVTTGTRFVASVPSSVPVLYITFELGVPSTVANPTSAPNYSISEAIGGVDSAPLAAQLATRIVSAAEQPQCLGSGRSVVVPGPMPNLTALEGSGSSSAGSIADATVVVAKGPYVINLAWTSQSSSASGAPPLPNSTEIAYLLGVALSHIPG